MKTTGILFSCTGVSVSAIVHTTAHMNTSCLQYARTHRQACWYRRTTRAGYRVPVLDYAPSNPLLLRTTRVRFFFCTSKYAPVLSTFIVNSKPNFFNFASTAVSNAIVASTGFPSAPIGSDIFAVLSIYSIVIIITSPFLPKTKINKCAYIGLGDTQLSCFRQIPDNTSPISVFLCLCTGAWQTGRNPCGLYPVVLCPHSLYALMSMLFIP